MKTTVYVDHNGSAFIYAAEYGTEVELYFNRSGPDSLSPKGLSVVHDYVTKWTDVLPRNWIAV